jgi:WD40 repeat protein
MSSLRTLLYALAGSLPLLSQAAAGDYGLDLINDSLPPYAAARLGTARLRHGQQVSALAFSPDGKSLLSVGWGEASLSTVRLWDAADGKEKWSVRQRFASCAAFTPDGRSIAVGGGIGVVRLWQAETGREMHKLTGDQGAVSAVAFSPDGKGMFTAGGSGKLHLWDATNGEEIRAFIGHDREVLALTLSGDGKTLASTGADGTLRVWEVETGKESLEIVLPHATDALALSSDGKTLFAADDGKVRRWTVLGKELTPLKVGDKPVQRLALSGDGRTLATSADDLILIWDVETGKIIGRIARLPGDVTALAFRADGKAIAAADANFILHLWEIPEGKERFAEQRHRGAVTAVAYSPKGNIAATASEDGVLLIWDATSGKPLRVCDDGRRWPSRLAFSDDGATLTAGGQGREVIGTWEVSTGRKLPPSHTADDPKKDGERNHFLKGIDATVHAVGPKDRLLAVGRADGLVFILEAASGKTICSHSRAQIAAQLRES